MQFKTEEQVYLDMIDYAVTNGLISVSDETLDKIKAGSVTDNQYLLDIATHAYTSAILFGNCSEVYRDIDISTAEGEALDRLGRFLHTPRVVGQPAMIDLNISLSTASGSNIVIPAGTRVLIDEVVPDCDLYVTSEEIIISAGATTATGKAECIIYGYRDVVPRTTVRGLNGFDTVTVTNPENGNNGVDIEEDDAYRERLLLWMSRNTRGTKACIMDYLDNYAGIDEYRLIPCFDGVGTLKVIVDGQSSVLSSLPSDLHDNAMLLTDSLPVCVQPEEEELPDMTVVCHIDFDRLTISQSELTQLLLAQISTYVSGGIRRDGSSYAGVSMGTDFNPSLLWKFLLEQFPEVSNIYSSTMYEVVSVDSNEKLVLGEVNISYDNVS